MITTLKCFVAIATCGLLAAGCGRGVDQDARGATDSRPVSMSGCLEAGAVGPTNYVLRYVHLDPPGAAEPHRNTTSGPDGITEGSWVTLISAENLESKIGRRVAVSGVVIDDGRNTIGTAGSSGRGRPSGDRSQAASGEHHSQKVMKEAGPIARESMANGTAAEIRVMQVKDLGEACQDRAIRR